MATKKSKSPSSNKGKPGGFIDRLKATKAKPKNAAAKTSKAKAAPSAKPAKPNGKVASADKGSAKGKPAKGETKAASAEPEKVKKKPPSITITRPEVTRPPVVLPPPRPLEAPIGAPSILVPKDGQPIPSLTPMLRWMYVGGATRYEVEWSHDAHFGRGHSITIVSIQTAISVDTTHELKPATLYKWRVRGGNDAGWGPWSPPESFRSPEKV